jgi:ArsR family transcriptional regulator
MLACAVHLYERRSIWMSVDLNPLTAGLRALAEPSRREIVRLLAREELCVCHLVDELGVDQSLVSHHLRVLREAGLVESDRFRYWTYYRLVPGVLSAMAGELAAMAEQAPSAGERRRACC